MLGQPEEKRSALEKKVFIKGRQETLDDVLTLISNIVVMGRYWITIDATTTKVDYPFVLKLLVELADILSSAEFREFESKFKSACPFMAHTLISYIFDLFRQFVKLAQNPHVIRVVKVSNVIPLKYIETALLMHVDLLHQLKLCVATGSVQHLFATAPLTFPTFCPGLAR